MIEQLPATIMVKEWSMSTRKHLVKKISDSGQSGAESAEAMAVMEPSLLGSHTTYLLEPWDPP